MGTLLEDIYVYTRALQGSMYVQVLPSPSTKNIFPIDWAKKHFICEIARAGLPHAFSLYYILQHSLGVLFS